MLRLDEILKEKGMSISDLETLMRHKGTPLSRISIGKILNNDTSPKVSTLEDISNALDVDIRSMFVYVDEDLYPIYRKDSNGNDEIIGYLRK